MKNLFLLLAFGASTLKVFSQLAAEYRFETAVGVGTPVPYFVNTSILASASSMYFGPGLTGAQGYTAGANAGGFGCNCQPNDKGIWADSWGTNASMLVNLNDHFGVTLTALPATIVFIDSVKWRERRSGTGPQAIQLRTSADGYTGVIWSGTNFSTNYVSRVVTSGLPSFTPATPLNIRLYGYNPTGQTGTLRIDSLKIYAHTFSTLPVELLSFTGKAIDQDVELAWTTASELNNDHFEVIRSDDGQAWYEVGRIPGSGTTTIPRDYGFLDRGPSAGVNYYKLRQVDVGGDYVDSHTISVDVGEQQWFRRVGDQIICDKPTMLFDALGQLISGPSHEHRIDRAGVLILQQEDRARSTRFVR